MTARRSSSIVMGRRGAGTGAQIRPAPINNPLATAEARGSLV